MSEHENRDTNYQKNSLSLIGSVAMGTGVMIGAGIFALTGQVAEQAGGLFPLAFVAAAVVAGFSAYSYVVMASEYPSAGGIAMILTKSYGRGTAAAGFALLMYFSMVINESLVARTFGTYTIQLFGGEANPYLVPALGVGLLVVVFLINIMGNWFVDRLSTVAAVLKIGGVVLFAAGGLWASGLAFESLGVSDKSSAGGFLAATALALLAYKGFTTITNSGAEIVEPKKNIGRSIIISLAVCVVVYVLVALAVAGNLSVSEIIESRDYALAEAARPAFGRYGQTFTIGLAILATFTGLIASTFAVSRMLGMLTEMKMVPHRHFGMPGSIQKHTLVYTVVFAIALTVLFDLSRIASLGAIFYIVMDIAVHWGVLRFMRKEVSVRAWVPITAIVLDVAILTAFIWVKAVHDPIVLGVAVAGMVIIFGGERLFLSHQADENNDEHENKPGDGSSK
jgi:amino acid transporter